MLSKVIDEVNPRIKIDSDEKLPLDGTGCYTIE